MYKKLKADIGQILRRLCGQKSVEIVEANTYADYIHMLVCIPLSLSVVQFIGFLKGKSSLMVFDRHANLKYKYSSRHFRCKGYYVNTIGCNKKAVTGYVRDQLREDIAPDQVSFKKYADPFTSSRNTKA